MAAQLDRDYIRDKTLEGQQTAAADDGSPIRPKPARIHLPGAPPPPADADLHRRLEDQVLHPQEPKTE